MKDEIAVLIPVRNRLKFTKKCLQCLSNQTFSEFQIYVFDDGSSDGTPEMIENEFQNVNVVKGDGTYWWSASINSLLQVALDKGADKFILLNDDVEFDDNLIEVFVKMSNMYPEAVLGAAGYDITSKELIYAGKLTGWAIGKAKDIINSLPTEEIISKEIIKCEMLHGRGLLIPLKVIKNIGLFDAKKFPQSLGDFDYTFRVYKNKIPLYCIPLAKMYYDTKETGLLKFKEKKNLRNFYLAMTSRRSAANLIVRWKFGIKHCPFFLKLNYLILDTMRSIYSYIR